MDPLYTFLKKTSEEIVRNENELKEAMNIVTSHIRNYYLTNLVNVICVSESDKQKLEELDKASIESSGSAVGERSEAKNFDEATINKLKHLLFLSRKEIDYIKTKLLSLDTALKLKIQETTIYLAYETTVLETILIQHNDLRQSFLSQSLILADYIENAGDSNMAEQTRNFAFQTYSKQLTKEDFEITKILFRKEF